MTPAVEGFQRIRQAEGEMSVTPAAKHIGMQPKSLFAFLREHRWIYRRANGGGWFAYQTRIEEGYLIHKPTTLKRDRGPDKVVEQVLITARGLAELAVITPPGAPPTCRKRKPRADGRQPDLSGALH